MKKGYKVIELENPNTGKVDHSFELPDCQFVDELLGDPKNKDFAGTNRAMYNLIVSKRDIGLYRIGMKPHRGFKISDVKRYFGIKGSGETLKTNFMEVFDKATELNKLIN